jgi:hypothetical protein
MRKHTQLLLGVTSAALFLALGVASATANSLSVSNQDFRAVWTPLALSGGGIEVRCDVTLEGSFHEATIAKVEGALIGSVTRASVDGNNCEPEEAKASILTETLPWLITYEGYIGELPNISGIEILLLRAEFLLELFGFVGCLYGTGPNQENPANGIVNVDPETGVVTGLKADETVPIPLQQELDIFGLCPSEGTFSGEATVTLLETENPISVTLI